MERTPEVNFSFTIYIIEFKIHRSTNILTYYSIYRSSHKTTILRRRWSLHDLRSLGPWNPKLPDPVRSEHPSSYVRSMWTYLRDLLSSAIRSFLTQISDPSLPPTTVFRSPCGFFRCLSFLKSSEWGVTGVTVI